MIITNIDGSDETPKFESTGAHTVSPFATSPRDRENRTDDESSSYNTPENEGPKMRPKFLKTLSSIEREARENAAYHDHGRHHFASERMAAIEEDDPFLGVFTFVDKLQELAVPLILGVILALILANFAPETYK
jgi:hypothetical protein